MQPCAQGLRRWREGLRPLLGKGLLRSTVCFTHEPPNSPPWWALEAAWASAPPLEPRKAPGMAARPGASLGSRQLYRLPSAPASLARFSPPFLVSQLPSVALAACRQPCAV